MLRKKDLRKKAHQLIRKDKLDHQEAYNRLKQLKSDCPKEEVAEIVSKVPSDAKNQKTLGLRVIFVICLGVVFILRSLDFIATISNLGLYSVIIFLFHGLTLPILGVYGALSGRTRFYKFIAVFMSLSTVVNLLVLFFLFHWIIVALTLPFAGAAVLGFIIPSKLKVPYKKKMVQRELRGRTINVYEYFFKESQTGSNEENSDLLDL